MVCNIVWWTVCGLFGECYGQQSARQLYNMVTVVKLLVVRETHHTGQWSDCLVWYIMVSVVKLVCDAWYGMVWYHTIGMVQQNALYRATERLLGVVCYG